MPKKPAPEPLPDLPDPETAEEFLQRAWRHHSTGDDLAAETDLKLAMALDSQLYDIHYLSGLIYRKRGQRESAINEFKRALEIVRSGAIQDDRNRHNMVQRMILSHLDFLNVKIPAEADQFGQA